MKSTRCSRRPALRSAALVACLLSLTGSSIAVVAEPRLAHTQRAYVWQRAWTPALQRAVGEYGREFAALDLLIAEITWREGQPLTERVVPQWPALVSCGRPVGLVVRIGPRNAAWLANTPATRAVLEACRWALADARRNGIEPAELQIDFDAATARLSVYRDLLRIVRREIHPARLTITALPDWLSSADFATLIAEADAYVLQVHSLEKPRAIGEAFTLCDPERAPAWIARASALGHPFRVALPAYGYRLVFDSAGKFAGLEAETGSRDWPEDHQTRLALADPAAIAGLVKEVLASPPTACEGICWFRFPIAGDELAWSWRTLQAVMRGDIPLPRLVLLSRATARGTLDLSQTNQGDASAEPTSFCVEWREARLLAADGLGGWRIERETPHTALVRPPPHGSNGLLRPGESVDVGWIRLDKPSALTCTPIN